MSSSWLNKPTSVVSDTDVDHWGDVAGSPWHLSDAAFYTCSFPGTAFQELTLPLASNIEGRTYTIKKVDSSSNVIRINPSGSDTIDSTGFIELFVNNDVVTVMSDGNNWITTSRNMSPHSTLLEASGVQAIAASTSVPITFDGKYHDIGGIGDLTNNYVEIRRDGKYLCQAQGAVHNIGYQHWGVVAVAITGQTITDRGFDPTLSWWPLSQYLGMVKSDFDSYANCEGVVNLKKGDFVRLVLAHSAAGSKNASSSDSQDQSYPSHYKPILRVTELTHNSIGTGIYEPLWRSP